MIISIFGRSGSGKSTIANSLVKSIHNSSRIRGDHYLKSKPRRISWAKYFANDQTDWVLIQKHLGHSLGSKVSTPTFDYIKFERLSEGGDKPFIVSEISIIDSVHPCPFADFKVLINVSKDNRSKRVQMRDRESPESPWKKTLEKRRNTEKPFVDELKEKGVVWDITIDGNSALENVVAGAEDAVTTHLSKPNYLPKEN